MTQTLRLGIETTWDGAPARSVEHAAVEVSPARGGLRVVVDAPWHGDDAPPAPAGRLDRLWEWEVVELFLLGADERYLELEFGPHGHYLALQLHGARNLLASDAQLDYVVAGPVNHRWRAEAFVPTGLLPDGLGWANAYAIHGQGAARRYLCHAAVPGERPDFHRLASFVPVPFALRPD